MAWAPQAFGSFNTCSWVTFILRNRSWSANSLQRHSISLAIASFRGTQHSAGGLEVAFKYAWQGMSFVTHVEAASLTSVEPPWANVSCFISHKPTKNHEENNKTNNVKMWLEAMRNGKTNTDLLICIVKGWDKKEQQRDDFFCLNYCKMNIQMETTAIYVEFFTICSASCSFPTLSLTPLKDRFPRLQFCFLLFPYLLLYLRWETFYYYKHS